ncbi:hypothetical protein DXG01_004941 [Tephrocybe rancida]|nr:hypothetical protein DXG01_004941 [Tephrocybe rancida]
MLSKAVPLLLLVSGLFVSSVHSTPVKRTVPRILLDLATVSVEATAFDNAAGALPITGPATLSQLLNVHTTITSLTSGIQDTTKEVKATPGPVSEDDAQSIIHAVESIAPTVIHALKTLKDRRAAFSGVPSAVEVILQDLNNLHTAVVTFFEALIKILPYDVIQAATADEAPVDAALQDAIAAFS